MEWGFVVTRYIGKMEHQDLCWQCVNSIRKFYPTTPILIIDDQSPIKDKHSYDDRVKIINNEFKGMGEFSFFYYFWKLCPFEYAVYLHDSTVVQSLIPLTFTQPVTMLWSFAYPQTIWCHDTNSCISNLIKSLNYSTKLLKLYHSKIWAGCFGCMVIIQHDFVAWIFRKYKLNIFTSGLSWNKAHRKAMERIIGLIIYNETGITKGLFGDIMTHPHAFSSGFQQDARLKTMPVIKTWHNR